MTVPGDAAEEEEGLPPGNDHAYVVAASIKQRTVAEGFTFALAHAGGTVASVTTGLPFTVIVRENGTDKHNPAEDLVTRVIV